MIELGRLSGLEVLALFGAAAALVVLLHLLRVQRRQVVVPFLPLWEELLERRASSRLFSRLSSLLSILLSLLIVLLLSLALGEPRLATGAQAKARVILLDAGLTMQATDVQPSRFEAARKLAQSIAAQANEQRPTAILQLTDEATPIAPFVSDRKLLSERLAALRPTDLETRIDAGYRLAIDSLARRGGGELFVLSDRPAPSSKELLARAEQYGIRVYRKSFGERSDNVAITAFAARRYPLDRNRSEVLLELQNASGHEERVELLLLGDGVPLDVRELTLEAGAREKRIYDDLASRGALLEARIRTLAPGHDDLAADDRAFTTLPAKRLRRVLCVTPGNRYLEAALLLDEQLQVDLIEAAPSELPSRYDAVIYDGAFPSEPPPVPALYLGLGAPPGMVQNGMLEAPHFDRIERDHPLLRYVSLADVNVAKASALRLSREDRALGSFRGAPLLAVGERERRPFVLLSFDVRESDLPLRVAFPVLLMNALDFLTGDDAEPPPVHTVGERLDLSQVITETSMRLREPDGRERALARALFLPEHAGIYTLASSEGSRSIPVGLSASARADLTPAPQAGPALPALESRALSMPLWALLAAVVLALLLLDFYAFHRRLLP